MKLIAVIVALLFISVIGAQDGHKSYERDLSDQEHHEDDDENHNSRYDHEAFLGKEDAEKFDQLSPDESKEKLGLIVDKIDKDKDGKITGEELRDWIRYISQKRLKEETKKQFSELEVEDGKLTWERYEERYYGKPEHRTEDEKETFKANLARDERKWKKADADGDGSLSESEYLAFLHPEEVPHMRDIVIEETLDDLDKDKDGFISKEEYIHDHWKPSDEEPNAPEWVDNERISFDKIRDKDGDGRMNKEEVGEWIVPKDYDHVNTESHHLIEHADNDKCGGFPTSLSYTDFHLFHSNDCSSMMIFQSTV